MNDRVFIASLAGLLHDLWKVGAWAGADVASAQEAILKQIDGFCKADSDDLAEAVKETVAAIVASHGDADAEPTEAAPALRAIASAITLSCTEDSAGLPAPSRNDAAGDVYIQPRDLAAVEETELRSAMFPGAKPAQQDYQRLWDSLLQELGQLLGSWTRRSASAPGVTQDAWRHQLVHGLLGLLLRFTSGVPAYPGDTLVPLYDHLRLTAAIQAARAAGGEEMLLVIGDISGIQDFIYRLQRRGEETQKGLAKRLRGRSFYLSALSRGFATYLAQLAGMSEANIVMAAGGNFQLLLPADAGLSLNQARKSINRWLLAEFRGRLALSLAWSRTTAEELQQPHAVAARIYDELSKAKLRKFTDLSGQDFLSTFRERITGECDSCGVAVTTDTQAPPSRDLSEADLRLCTNCWNARAIGDVLPDARFVAWHIGPLPDFAAPGNAIRSSTSGDIVRIELGRGLGENGQDVILAWPLERNCDDALSKGLLVDALCREDAQTPGVAWWPVAGHVAAVKDGEALRNFTEANKDRLPAGEDEELHEGDMLPFDWLSTLSRGDELIGVLRLDADHMGRVFGEGLQRLCAQAGLGTTDALACYMALSRYIDTFFGAWVDHVVQEEFREACKRASDFSGHIQAPLSKGEPERAFSSCFYTAYAGGDDLFIVGPWSETIHLAARLEADYSEYVCYNPDLTLSAGLLVSKPRVPIYMLAEAAGELERRSKEEGRNRITLFSTTLPWRSNGPGTTQSGAHTAPPQPSLQSGLELADIFARAVAGMLRRADDASGRAGGSPRSQARATKLPRGFLHLLLRLSARYAAREERAGAPPDYRYVPLLVWYLARTVAKVNLEIGDGSARKTLSGVLAEYLLASAAGGSRPWLREIKVPVSIALYLTRGGS